MCTEKKICSQENSYDGIVKLFFWHFVKNNIGPGKENTLLEINWKKYPMFIPTVSCLASYSGFHFYLTVKIGNKTETDRIHWVTVA